MKWAAKISDPQYAINTYGGLFVPILDSCTHTMFRVMLAFIVAYQLSSRVVAIGITVGVNWALCNGFDISQLLDQFGVSEVGRPDHECFYCFSN
jgi:hypothetical protein